MNDRSPRTLPERPSSQSLIQTWIVNRLARMLDVAAAEIKINDPLSDYGLESVEAIALSGDLSEFLGRKFPPTLFWDYPTIAELANFLSKEMNNDPALEAS